MTSHSILIITEDQRRTIKENVNISDEQLEKDTDAVLVWFGKQQHLPRINLDRRIIECILISRKGSVEQTKQKIDMMYTLRNLIPEMTAPRDILNPRIYDSFKGCIFVTLPKLNHDHTRVSIIKYKDAEFFSVLDLANFILTMTEYRLLHDCFSGERYVVDLEEMSFAHLTKYPPAVIKKCEVYMRKAYGVRIFGIHVVNGSNLFNKVLDLLKSGLSEKISSRIRVHPTYEDMQSEIDKDILPLEYNGKERPVAELLDMWKKELAKEENRNYLIEQETLHSDESLRIGCKLDDELLGVAGSFRNLDVF